MANNARKQKRSYTLSKVLDELIAEAGRRQRKEETHQAMEDYYANLSGAEVAEDRAWGQFGLQQASKTKDWA